MTLVKPAKVKEAYAEEPYDDDCQTHVVTHITATVTCPYCQSGRTENFELCVEELVKCIKCYRYFVVVLRLEASATYYAICPMTTWLDPDEVGEL